MNEKVGDRRHILLIPTGNGWNAEVHRVFTRPKKYYGISNASVKRFERLVNDEHNSADAIGARIELGRTGWAEFKIYSYKRIPFKTG